MQNFSSPIAVQNITGYDGPTCEGARRGIKNIRHSLKGTPEISGISGYWRAVALGEGE